MTGYALERANTNRLAIGFFLLFSLLSLTITNLRKIIVKEWSKGNDVKYLDSIPGISPFLAAFGSFQREPMKSIYVRYKARGLHHNTVLCILGRKILRIAVSLLKKRRVFDESKLSTEESLTGT